MAYQWVVIARLLKTQKVRNTWRPTLGVSRRGLLKTLGLWVFPSFLGTPMPLHDKEALIAMFDKAGIDLDDDKQQVTVKVNGSEVTGTEGGQVIFKFGTRGQLTEMVVWNAGISDQKETG